MEVSNTTSLETPKTILIKSLQLELANRKAEEDTPKTKIIKSLQLELASKEAKEQEEIKKKNDELDRLIAAASVSAAASANLESSQVMRVTIGGWVTSHIL